METQEDTELIGGVAGIATEAASSRIHTCNFWNDVLQFFFSPRRCHGFDFNFILIPEIKDISQAHALPQLEAGYLGNLVTKQNFTDQRSKELH